MNGLWARAERQYGVVTREQARTEGMTNRQIDTLLANGRLERIFSGVYRVAGSPRTARQRAMAACFFAGAGALCSHQTAGALLKLDGIRSRDLHVTVRHAIRRRAVDRLQLHRTVDLLRLDCVVVDDLPTTSGTRTILDLAAVVGSEQLEVAFESARRMQLTSPALLARRFARLGGRGRPGSAELRRLLDLAGAKPSESPLEVKLHRLLRRSRLPAPELQQWITGADGHRYRVDFVWVAERIIVECDGFAWHGDRLAWKRDRRRIAALEAAGWRVVQVTWDDVTRRSAETLFRIASALNLAA